MEEKRSTWVVRFMGVTFILGGIAWLIITLLVLGNVLAGLEPPNYALGPASSRIVAGGGAGMWFVMGILSYLIVGIAGLGLSALFFQHLEASLGAPLSGWRNAAAWIHLLLGGIGAAAASLLMTYGGYQAGIAALDPKYGGGGQTGLWIHTNVLGPLVVPIAALMGVALVGYLIGGLGIVTAWWTARKA
ncbi:MAG: hypothetical protein AABX97_02220 [Candidatus Thermoplasmatota archaeon]